MSNHLSEVRKLLAEYGQEHLLMKYDEFSPEKQEKLLAQIESIDFKLMEELYLQATNPVINEEITVEPISYIDKDALPVPKASCYRELGEDAIRDRKLAVVTMAGGQGTRLGFNGPKGAFIFDKENNMSIFEALTNTLKKVCDQFLVDIPWYIMTSSENNAETISFFEENNYFGYEKSAVKFFVQGELPMLDFNGKILLDENYMVKKAANGHGGTLYSMEKSGVLDELRAKGIEWVSINGVDNVLVKPIDPIFIGLSIQRNVLGSIKSISKAEPKEKVGVICKKNGKVGVVEYTEISEKMANLRDENGNLVYGDAYALFNLYNIEGLNRVAEISLPYHVAVKKADYIDCSGKFVKADKPNAYKFEMFIFDSYEMFKNVVVLRVQREDEFAPIKNAEGVDSPETALKLYRAFMSKQ